MEYTVYLAGSITGKSYDACTEWRRKVELEFPKNLIAFNPLRNKEFLSDREIMPDKDETHLLSTPGGIFTRDMSDCRRCDAMLGNLLKSEKVSIGTIMEIASFWWQSKPIVLIMEDNNIHRHPMIEAATPYIVDNLDDGIKLIYSILLPGFVAKRHRR
jgi:nucleoside 2-deoxyribosyltransferase